MCLHARKQASKQTESNLAWCTVLDAMCVCALSKVQDCVLSLSLPAGVIKDNPKASSIWHNAGIFVVNSEPAHININCSLRPMLLLLVVITTQGEGGT